MKTKTIRISRELPAPPLEIWERLQRLSTLQHIASPLATFLPLDESAGIWQEGAQTSYDLKLLGVISLGAHTIRVLQFDRGKLSVYTSEENKMVPVWRHRIILKDLGNGRAHYTDEVEIGAGWKTVFVCLWGQLFYRHRQKKWAKLLKN